jgi:hypothetical protein
MSTAFLSSFRPDLVCSFRERSAMSSRSTARMIRLLVAVAGLCVVLASGTAMAAPKPQPQQTSFATPQAAAEALFQAAKAKDQAAIVGILGPSFRDWILSGDPVQDAQRVERFVTAYGQKSRVTNEGDAKAVLSVGDDDFPFPFPIVKSGDAWRFDPEAGREEMLNRAIGRNELNTIQTLLAIVDAQRDYAARPRPDNAAPDYAQKFRSSPGKTDGLFWPTQQGEPASPLGPLVAGAVREGYKAKDSGPVPFHGYYFRILTRQGDKAPGGATDYVVKGRMIGGFAALAYPARYGISGVKTFAVSHDGVVYETDLGADTGKAAPKITTFNPDSRWTKVEPPKG